MTLIKRPGNQQVNFQLHIDMIRERRNFVELEQELNRKLLKFVQELLIIRPLCSGGSPGILRSRPTGRTVGKIGSSLEIQIRRHFGSS